MKKIRLWVCFVFFVVSLAVLWGCSGKQVKKDEDFDAEKFLTKSVTLIDERNYEDARKLLLEVKNRDTSKKYAPLAQLRIADSYIKDGDPEHGIEEYRKFLDLYPDNPKASYVQYQIAMAYFHQIDGVDRGIGAAKNALKEFNRLKELYPRNPYREIIALRIEKCNDLLADGEFYVGQFYFKKESYQAAIVRLENLLRQYPDYKGADRTLLLLGESYKALRMTDKARELFRTLVDKYPSSQFAKAAKKYAQAK